MRSIYIAISDDAADKLRELARREFRAPRQQAAVLVLAGLERAGLDLELRLEECTELLVAKPGRPPRGSGTAARADSLDSAG
jgi:hypothetical protein